MAVLGIDVSKDDFHCCLLADERPQQRSFKNTPEGFGEVVAWVTESAGPKARTPSDVRACMEATGPYWRDLAGALYIAGFTVSVVNPSRTAMFARSQLRRTKTDKVDAAMIADFCSTQSPGKWSPCASEILELRAVLSYRAQLVGQKIALEQLIAQVPTSDVLAGVHAAQIAAIDQAKRILEAQLRAIVGTHRELQHQVGLLTSIPGVGELTAVTLVAKLPLERLRDARAAAAYVGLTPSERQSGTSVHGRARICRTGNGELRRDLYMPALSAMRYNPDLHAFAERLRARGKAGKLIAVAVMRKLVVLAYTLLKKGVPFSPKSTANA